MLTELPDWSKLKEPRRVPKAFTVDEFHKILAAADLITDQNRSPARYLLSTLIPCMQRGFSDVFTALFERIQRNHMSEPGIAQALYQLLVSMGVMTPDGKLSEQAAAAATAESPAPGGQFQ